MSVCALAHERFWDNKAECDDAERKYYLKLSGAKVELKPKINYFLYFLTHTLPRLICFLPILICLFRNRVIFLWNPWFEFDFVAAGFSIRLSSDSSFRCRCCCCFCWPFRRSSPLVAFQRESLRSADWLYFLSPSPHSPSPSIDSSVPPKQESTLRFTTSEEVKHFS